MSNAHIEWLQRKWALPKARTALLERLLEARRNGDTALAVDFSELEGDWGNALGVPGESKPLLRLQVDGRWHLQACTDHFTEAAIADRIRELRTASGGCRVLGPGDEASIAELFPIESSGEPNLQGEAARCALSHPFTLITGGPGTGKTYTLARLLALLLRRQSQSPEADSTITRIRLAAPTGKAADRMREAVRGALALLPEHYAEAVPLLEQAALGSTTLHSLLGYRPDTGHCRHDASNPLPAEILIVDEASMIDARLWRAVLDAFAPGPDHRLIVLGDPHQLESVGAGDVLHQLVTAPELADCHVRLIRTRRFEGREDIQKLAAHIISRESEAAARLLAQRRSGQLSQGLLWLGESAPEGFWNVLPESLQRRLLDAACAETPELALAALARVRILCAHRASRQGASGLGESLLRALRRANPHPSRPVNEPLIISENDPETGLRNGSVGIVCSAADGSRRAWFPPAREGGEPIAHSLARLPAYESAWALTIHRSQGSEFDDVIVVLPSDESPLATRELLYTAITRARRSVSILGPLETVRRAVADSGRRVTLLGHLLAPQAAKQSD